MSFGAPVPRPPEVRENPARLGCPEGQFLRFELLHVMYGEPADVMTTLYAGFGKNHLSRLLLARFVDILT